MYDKIILIAIAAIIGVFIKHLWDKYVGRITKLKYSIWHNYIGSSVEDSRFGSVKLQYNENDVKNLYTSNIYLTNDSGRDVEDLELVISCDDESLIIISHAKNRNSLKDLEFTENFNEIVDQGGDDPNNNIYFYQNREYLIPVINRGDTIDINLLTTNTKGDQPLIYISTEHPGVKLKHQAESVKLLGVSQSKSALIGIIISLLVCIPIYLYIISIFWIIGLTLLNGLFATLYGVLILKLNQAIIKFQNN